MLWEIETFEVRASPNQIEVDLQGQKKDKSADLPPRRRRPRGGCQMSAGGQGLTEDRQLHALSPRRRRPCGERQCVSLGLEALQRRSNYVVNAEKSVFINFQDSVTCAG